MSNFPWLTTIGLIPLVGALVVAFLPASLADRAKQIALGFSVVALLFTVAAALQFTSDSGQQFQLQEQHSWIAQFGVSYALGVDGIALVLIVMSAILVPVCLLAAWHDVPEVGKRQQNYFALMLVLETFMVGVFSATDVFLFYVFFEAMLIPVYFLIGSYGGPRRQYAAVKFLLFSLLGGLVMLVAVIALYHYGPGGADGFLVTKLTGLHLGTTPERLMFVAFFRKAQRISRTDRRWLDTWRAADQAASGAIDAFLDGLGDEPFEPTTTSSPLAIPRLCASFADSSTSAAGRWNWISGTRSTAGPENSGR